MPLSPHFVKKHSVSPEEEPKGGDGLLNGDQRSHPPKEQEAKQQQVDFDGVQKFLLECCELAPDAEIHKPELFEKYQRFCHACGYRPKSRNKFYARVLELRPQVSATLIGQKRIAGFKGLKLKESS